MMIGNITPPRPAHLTSHMPYKGIMTVLTYESTKTGGTSIREV